MSGWEAEAPSDHSKFSGNILSSVNMGVEKSVGNSGRCSFRKCFSLVLVLNVCVCLSVCLVWSVCLYQTRSGREIERQIHREIKRQRDTERQTDRYTYRDRESEIHRETDRQR